MSVARLSAVRTGRVYLQDKSLVLISVRGRFNPRAIMQPEEKQLCIYRNSLRVSANKRKRAYSILIWLPLHDMGTAAPDKVLTGENKLKIRICKNKDFL